MEDFSLRVYRTELEKGSDPNGSEDLPCMLVSRLRREGVVRVRSMYENRTRSRDAIDLHLN